jgi:hypothetical protein
MISESCFGLILYGFCLAGSFEGIAQGNSASAPKPDRADRDHAGGASQPKAELPRAFPLRPLHCAMQHVGR